MQENSTKQGSLVAFIAQIYKKKVVFLTLLGHGS